MIVNPPVPLSERVRQFNGMELPGQVGATHIGTQYLVNDLWREVQRLQQEKQFVTKQSRSRLTWFEHLQRACIELKNQDRSEFEDVTLAMLTWLRDMVETKQGG